MIKLINNDSLIALNDLIGGGEKVDLTVTSPPYDTLRNYNDNLNWNFDIFKNIADLLFNITVDGGIVVWVVNDATINGSKTLTSFKQALYFKDIGFNVHDVMLFAKNNPIPQLFHKRYNDAFEYMFIFSKGAPKTCNPLKEPCKLAGTKIKSFKRIDKTDNRQRLNKMGTVNNEKIKSNIWYYTVGGGDTKKYKHPAMFPLDLAKDHILSWTNPNDTVLDCFMGSGTTGVACLQCNRNFIGIEIEEKYYNMAKERCSEYQSILW